MAGPAIRATELASVVRDAGHEVRLDTPAGDHDIVVAQGWCSSATPRWRRRPRTSSSTSTTRSTSNCCTSWAGGPRAPAGAGQRGARAARPGARRRLLPLRLRAPARLLAGIPERARTGQPGYARRRPHAARSDRRRPVRDPRAPARALGDGNARAARLVRRGPRAAVGRRRVRLVRPRDGRARWSASRACTSCSWRRGTRTPSSRRRPRWKPRGARRGSGVHTRSGCRTSAGPTGCSMPTSASRPTGMTWRPASPSAPASSTTCGPGCPFSARPAMPWRTRCSASTRGCARRATWTAGGRRSKRWSATRRAGRPARPGRRPGADAHLGARRRPAARLLRGAAARGRPRGGRAAAPDPRQDPVAAPAGRTRAAPPEIVTGVSWPRVHGDHGRPRRLGATPARRPSCGPAPSRRGAVAGVRPRPIRVLPARPPALRRRLHDPRGGRGVGDARAPRRGARGVRSRARRAGLGPGDFPLRPILGTRNVLLLDGAEHLRRRKLVPALPRRADEGLRADHRGRDRARPRGLAPGRAVRGPAPHAGDHLRGHPARRVRGGGGWAARPAAPRSPGASSWTTRLAAGPGVRLSRPRAGDGAARLPPSGRRGRRRGPGGDRPAADGGGPGRARTCSRCSSRRATRAASR